jgi:hypothetical protein
MQTVRTRARTHANIRKRAHASTRTHTRARIHACVRTHARAHADLSCKSMRRRSSGSSHVFVSCTVKSSHRSARSSVRARAQLRVSECAFFRGAAAGGGGMGWRRTQGDGIRGKGKTCSLLTKIAARRRWRDGCACSRAYRGSRFLRHRPGSSTTPSTAGRSPTALPPSGPDRPEPARLGLRLRRVVRAEVGVVLVERMDVPAPPAAGY